jgi:hypothetical protein
MKVLCASSSAERDNDTTQTRRSLREQQGELTLKCQAMHLAELAQFDSRCYVIFILISGGFP